jgi:hypothetical protein
MPMDARAQRKVPVKLGCSSDTYRPGGVELDASPVLAWRRSGRATGSRPPRGRRPVREQPRSGRPDQAPACALIGEHLPLTTGEYNFPLRGSRPPYYFFLLRQSSHSHARSEGLCQSSDVVWKQVSLCQCQAVVPRTRGSTRARAGTDSVYLYISLRRRLFIIPSLELEALQHTYLIYSFSIVTRTQKLV